MSTRDRVTEHAEKVASGIVPAGELHRLACERHLKDLERQGTKDFPYIYSPQKAGEVIDFAETLTLAEGDEMRSVILLPEQAFDIGCTLGWLKTSNQIRRFRRRYKSVARQNGKSIENGILGTYIAAFSGYHYGRLFTAATKRRQSRITWDEMVKFIESDADLKKYFKITDYKSLITCLPTKCTIEALSKEGGLEDGFRSIFSSVDEIHQHKDNKIYKALYNGTRALPETLVSMITTRGDNPNSFCKEMDDYCINILRGMATAEDFFVDIYALDPNDDIWDPANWIKANPFICSRPELLEILSVDAQTARDMGGADLRDFMIKSLNLWVTNTDAVFVDAEKWKQSGSGRTIADFAGQSCWVGIDLSSGGDLTTYALEFDDMPDERIYIYSHSYMPRGRLIEHVQSDLAPYDLWEQMELITVTGGELDFKNDYKFIIAELKKLQANYGLQFKGIGIDPHNADGVLADLEEFGCPVVTITQSCKSLNDATVDMQLLIKSGKVEHDEHNELLTWSFLNAKIVKNSFEEIKVDKKDGARNKRIDPVDASINAHAIKLKIDEKPQAVDPNEAMADYLRQMGWR